MASIDKRVRNGQLTWRVRYRDPSGDSRSKSFRRKVDAEQFLVANEAAKQSGSYVDPGRARVTVDEWSRQWLENQVQLKPSTRERYASILRKHVVPRWGTTKLANVSHDAVQSWIQELTSDRAAATVQKIHRVLSLVLSSAVRDGRLVRNPADGVKLPRPEQSERLYLTHNEVHALVDTVGPKYGLVVKFLAYTGVRFGEMAALRIKNLDLLRRRAHIAESVTEIKGGLVWGTPKNHERRTVPIPRFLVDDLAQHVAGRSQDQLAFPGVKGGVLRVRTFRRGGFDAAAETLGLDGMHPHALRHTAASLAIASGANVKVVQQMLGHKSATMTLDLYGHLFPDQLDSVADALDTAVREAGVSPACPEAETAIVGTKRVITKRAG